MISELDKVRSVVYTAVIGSGANLTSYCHFVLITTTSAWAGFVFGVMPVSYFRLLIKEGSLFKVRLCWVIHLTSLKVTRISESCGIGNGKCLLVESALDP